MGFNVSFGAVASVVVPILGKAVFFYELQYFIIGVELAAILLPIIVPGPGAEGRVGVAVCKGYCFLNQTPQREF